MLWHSVSWNTEASKHSQKQQQQEKGKEEERGHGA
jgi:hypothetical protein